MSSCDVCRSRFATKSAATQHKNATGHCVCRHCNKALASSSGLDAHNKTVHYHRCPQCSATFPWRKTLANHQRKQSHCYCGDCNRTFGTTVGLKSHLQSSLHSTEFRCCDCDREFQSAAALDQHLRHKVHRNRAAPQRKHRDKKRRNLRSEKSTLHCSMCEQQFKTATALQQHLASVRHHPLGQLRCTASALCRASFSSPSALLHHLESGACPSNMDRDTIKALVMKYDTERLFTKRPASEGLLLEGSTDDCSDSWNLIRTPSSASLSSLGDGYWTPASGSLSDWTHLVSQGPSRRCPFCSPGRRPFRDASALQDHIQSAAHCQPFIYCPVAFTSSGNGGVVAKRAFTTVSGLAQQLESGACIGGKDSFWKVMKYLEMRFQESGVSFRLAGGKYTYN